MRVTGSALPILARCQWWARPDVEAPVRGDTKEMNLGRLVHGAIEAILRGEPCPELPDEAADMVDVWGSWWADQPLGPGIWRPEVAVAYDPHADTARELGDIRGRAYPETKPTEVAGTIDAVRVEAGVATVIDWKTGSDWSGLTADAADNLQLRGYALAISRAHHVETVRVVIVRIDDEVSTTSYEYDALELAAAADELRRQLAAIPTAHPQPGPWCKRCRAVAVCPETVAAVDQLVPAGPVPAPVPLKINADNAAAVLARLRAVEAACEQVESALKAFAEANGGIATADGKLWRKAIVERSTIRLDGPEAAIALDALDRLGLADAVERKVTTSKAAIERAVSATGAKGKAKTAAVTAALDELRAAGAVRVSQVETWKES